MAEHSEYRYSGARAWLVSCCVGAICGLALTALMPPQLDPAGHPQVGLFLVAPFALLLFLIAAMPLINSRLWHAHFPDAAFFLGAFVVAYYLAGYGHHGREQLVHAAQEYYSFIALVGGLYVVSGGILTDIRGRGGPWSNTAILAFGAVLANVVGTTGASVLLIRPFIRFNRGRLRPMHVVFFIFIVSNCGGCLTPIGDPPLYLGYLKGVPFAWTMSHLLPNWLVTVGPLLAMFFAMDSYFQRAHGRRNVQHTDAPEPQLHRRPHGPPVTLQGRTGMVCLVLIVLGVFIDPLLRQAGWTGHFPVGATFQIAIAAIAYFASDRELYRSNEFSFFPVKEVGLLFLGIFATMVPALAYLAAHGPALNVRTPTQFYFLTGLLSAVLDNAPTYMNFLQLAVGDAELTRETIASRLLTGDGARLLAAISTGAVFFGAMTYIGNGPNFMVRAIAESAGVKMPSFLGYLLRASALLLPVLVLHWWFAIALQS